MVINITYNQETRSFSIDKDKVEKEIIEHADRASNRYISGQSHQMIKRANGLKLGKADKFGAVKNAVKGKLTGRGGRANAAAELASKKTAALMGVAGVKSDTIKKASGIAGGVGAVAGEGQKILKKYRKGNIFGRKREVNLSNIVEDATKLAKRYNQGHATGVNRSNKVTRGINDEKITDKIKL